MVENSSVLCTSATIASTCTRFFGRGVSDAAALSFSVRGLAGALAFDPGDAFFAGLRAGNPLNIRFLTVGMAALEALGVTLAGDSGATAANTAASTDGVHAPAVASSSSAVPLLTVGAVVSCWSGAILRDALSRLAIQCSVSPGFGKSLLC